jgi:hypothetical protein
MEHWTATSSQLSQALAAEQALARRRRQEEWRRLLQEGKRLRAFLVFCLASF